MLISIIAAGAAAATTFNILDAIENKIAEKRAAKKMAAASAAAIPTTPTPAPTPVPVQPEFVPSTPVVVQEEQVEDEIPSEEEGDGPVAEAIIQQVTDLQTEILSPVTEPEEPAEEQAPSVDSEPAEEESTPAETPANESTPEHPNTVTLNELIKGSKVKILKNIDINGNAFNKGGVYTVVNVEGGIAEITRGKKKRVIKIEVSNLEIV